MKRTTILLSDDQAHVIEKLSSALDIDQGKAVRWIVSTLCEIAHTHDDQDPCLKCKDMKPQAKYLLDTLSSILIK